MRDLIITVLDEMFPDPKCELNFNNNYELLIAVILSAQTTDKSVNKVTPFLFEQYPLREFCKHRNSHELFQKHRQHSLCQ